MEESFCDAPFDGQTSSRTVSFVTLGCAKNEVDSAHMADRLSHAGYTIIDDPEQADAIIINTCSFIQAATEESIDAIFELASLDRVSCGNAHLVVAGCMPARYGDDLTEELSEASAFVPCAGEDSIVEVISGLIGLPTQRASADSDTADETGEGDASAGESNLSSPSAPFAYVKISDGCDRWCSYCTIPLIRGRYHSFPYERIYDEVNARVASGAREIVLIAQDTGRWGSDFAEPSSLAELITRLAEAFPHAWFRVMYIQPEGVSDAYIDAVATHDNICNYFDIPLQHVDAAILASMNRTGSREQFVDLVQRIKERIPDATLRTTLIAGYPGETDEQFEDLLDFVEEGLFDYVGVFPYSREEGTRAADLPDQIEEACKIERAQNIRDAADAVSVARVAERIGSTLRVLVEGREEDGQLFGRAMCQAPDVDGCTYLSSGTVGDIVDVRIVDTLFYEMEGESR